MQRIDTFNHYINEWVPSKFGGHEGIGLGASKDIPIAFISNEPTLHIAFVRRGVNIMGVVNIGMFDTIDDAKKACIKALKKYKYKIVKTDLSNLL